MITQANMERWVFTNWFGIREISCSPYREVGGGTNRASVSLRGCRIAEVLFPQLVLLLTFP